MSDHRRVLMAGMMGTLVLASVLCVLVFIPFEVSVYSIDRRTGNTTAEVTYWGLYRELLPENPDQNRYYQKLGTFTAGTRWMPHTRIIHRFPWTKVGLGEDIPPGGNYSVIFHELFTSVRSWGTDQRKIPDSECAEIIRRRIQLWNSAEVDRDPQAVIERLRKENQELHRLPSP